MPSTNRLSNILWTVAAMCLAAVLVWMSMHKAPQHHEPLITFTRSQLQIERADGSKIDFDVEVAKTDEQQERGLMFRKNLAPNAGMIFIWPEDQVINMWMKNTEIPLDMLFVAHDGKIVKVLANTVPFDLTNLSSDQPVRAVIEIGGGGADRQNIRVGDRINASEFSAKP